jgi:alcohol dehydrogenase class IV
MPQIAGNWNYPTKMIFGPGRIAKLAQACRSVGMTRPLLVTDPGLAKLPMVESALAANRADGLPTEIFADVKGNPIGRNVSDGVAQFLAGGHDGVIALGGGSGIDAAKAIALMSGQSRPLWDFEDVGDNWTRADTAGIAPIVAVPTTAGTGSEVGRASVIVQEESHAKKIIFHPDMLPRVVISDPELTVGLPAHGRAGPLFRGLLRARLPPHGRRHRGRRHAAGAPMAAPGGSRGRRYRGTGQHAGRRFHGSHRLSERPRRHPLAEPPHRRVMPYVMAHNRPAIAERMERLAAYIGLDQHSFAGVMDWVLQLRELLDIPPTLADLGLDDKRADEICEAAAGDPTAPTNPVPLDTKILRAMFDDALAGRIA